jgi:hypothetical protein
MDILLIVGCFLFVSWWLTADHKPSRPSKETLNEACPNHNTGNFAVFVQDDIVIQHEQETHNEPEIKP